MPRQSIKPLWPKTLSVPTPPPKLIYLDLNHWIQLSKAHAGHRDGNNYKEILAACRKAVMDGTAVFPLSLHTYMEISRIKHRQRRDLCEVVEEISRFMVVTPRHVVAEHEVETLLDQIVGPSPQPISTMNYLNSGGYQGLGIVGGIKLETASGKDATSGLQRLLDDPQAWDTLLQEVGLHLNRKEIEGPTPKEELKLQEQGWNPDAIHKAYVREAKAEANLARKLSRTTRQRPDDLRGVISVSELVDGSIFATISLKKGLANRGIDSMEEFLEESPYGSNLDVFSSMSSFDVAVTLKTSYHRNSNHRWTKNDIFDINAVAGTLPYCHVVVSDKSVWHHAKRNNLHKRLNTIILAHLSDLPEYL